MTNADAMLRACLQQILDRGVVLAREFLRSTQGSETLQREMTSVIDSIERGVATGRVTAPFYWALYVHDGRGAQFAKPGHYLCFFPRKQDDPRTRFAQDYAPTRGIRDSEAGRFHLTRKLFYEYLAMNKALVEAGQRPIMIVTKSVGPVFKARPFFSVGLATLRNDVARIVPDQFRLFLQGQGLIGTAPKSLILPAKIG